MPPFVKLSLLLVLPPLALALGLWCIAPPPEPAWAMLPATPCAELLSVGSESGGVAALASGRPASSPMAPPDSMAIRHPVPGDASQLPGRSRARIRVCGQVRRCGQPVPRCELTFYFAGQEWRDRHADWDLTDREGRYEVEIPAATYLVCCDAGWGAVITLVLRSGQGPLAFDIELPP